MARLCRLLTLCAALVACSASPAHALEVGIADQQATSFSDARLLALNLRYARYVVPWNAATAQPAKVRAWIDAVTARGMEPHIAFQHSAGDRCPNRPCTLPTVAQYRSAVTQFVALFPQVRTYTTWNEGNHTLQPTRTNPTIVASYYQELRAACPTCTVVAVSVLDSGGFESWTRAFLSALPEPPQLWGLHNWGDQRDGGTGSIDTMLSLVPGTLWLEETGALVGLRNRFGERTAELSDSETSEPIARVFGAARARARLGRLYVYQWVGGGPTFDSGLTDGAGGLRAAYHELKRQLGLGTPAAATPAARPAAWTAAWSSVRRGQLVLRGRCPVAGTRCTGRLTVTLRVRTAAGRVLVRARLRSGAYATSGPSRRVTWRIAVPAKVRAAARRAGTRRAVLLAGRATKPAAARVQRTLSLPRPG